MAPKANVLAVPTVLKNRIMPVSFVHAALSGSTGWQPCCSSVRQIFKRRLARGSAKRTPAPRERSTGSSNEIPARAGLIFEDTDSGIHRCHHRQSISCMPDVAGDKPKRHKFKK